MKPNILKYKKLFRKVLLILLCVFSFIFSGCGVIESCERRKHDHDQILFPATIYDLELFVRSQTRNTTNLSINNNRSIIMDHLIIPVYALVDLPLSITADVIILPYDTYQVMTVPKPEGDYNRYYPFLWRYEQFSKKNAKPQDGAHAKGRQ